MAKYIAVTLAFLWMLAVAQQAMSSCYNGDTGITFTNYWTAQEGAVDLDGEREIILTGPKTKTLFGENGETIATVDYNTYHKCAVEGTCSLANGVLINVGNQTGVFVKVDRSSYPFGIGAWDNPLRPFASVASGVLPKFSKLFVAELENVALPNGRIHNGCVRVDDRGSGLEDCQIDLFVLKYANYKTLRARLGDVAHVVQHSACEVLSYTDVWGPEGGDNL